VGCQAVPLPHESGNLRPILAIHGKDEKLPMPFKPFLVPCPSGKVQYEEKIDGLISIVKWELANSTRRPIRIYECRLCGALHLTSQEPKFEEPDGDK